MGADGVITNDPRLFALRPRSRAQAACGPTHVAAAPRLGAVLTTRQRV